MLKCMEIYFCALVDWSGVTTVPDEFYPSMNNVIYICPSLKHKCSVIWVRISDIENITLAVPNSSIQLVENQRLIFLSERIEYATDILLPILESRRQTGLDW